MSACVLTPAPMSRAFRCALVSPPSLGVHPLVAVQPDPATSVPPSALDCRDGMRTKLYVLDDHEEESDDGKFEDESVG